MKRLRLQTLQSLAQSAGLSILSVTDLTPLTEAVKPLNYWQSAGMAGAMQYMNRSPELLSNPAQLLPEGKSAVCLALAYSAAQPTTRPEGCGRVARYAWGRDYHEVIPKRLEELVKLVEAEVHSPVRSRIFTDATPLLERALAARAHLGFIGKNTMLIRPGFGSFFFIAEILWDIEIVESSLKPLQGSCGSCTRCLDRCPTQAFVSPYVLDARKCISYLSIEHRGALEPKERQALGEWIFGCDICQEVCPFNHGSIKEGGEPGEAQFSAKAGVGPFLSLGEVLRIRTNPEYRGRFSGTALLRAKRASLLRNAACVAANTGSAQVLPDLCLGLQDADAVVRMHSLWAIGKLRSAGASLPAGENWEILLRRMASDPDAIVRDEAASLQDADF